MYTYILLYWYINELHINNYNILLYKETLITILFYINIALLFLEVLK